MKKILHTILISLIATEISIIHYTLNLFQRNKKITDILYSYYDNDQILKPIINKLPGTSLHSISIFKKKSFLKRRNEKNHVQFNNIITIPFIGIYFDMKQFREKFKHYLYINHKKFLEKNNFSKIVMIDEFSMPNTTLCMAGHDLHITTFGVQHGLIYTNDKYYESKEGYIEYKKRKDSREIVDHMIVFSNEEKEYLNHKSQHMHAIALGSPRYDALAQKKTQKENKNLIKSLQLNKNKKTIVWATQTHYNDMVNLIENQKNCQALFPFFSKRKNNFNFIIKLHPNEDQTAPLYRKWNKKYGNIAQIIGTQVNTLDLLKVSDALIVKHSTVGAESILIGRPPIFLNIIKSADISLYTKEGFNLVIKQASDVEKHINYIFTKKSKLEFEQTRKRFIKKRFKNFGHATEEVVEYIKKNN